MLLHGGKGGLGNTRFKSSTNRALENLQKELWRRIYNLASIKNDS